MNSHTPNPTKVKTKELSKDTRIKPVDLHQAGKSESTTDEQVGVNKSTVGSTGRRWKTYKTIDLSDLGPHARSHPVWSK